MTALRLSAVLAILVAIGGQNLAQDPVTGSAEEGDVPVTQPETTGQSEKEMPEALRAPVIDFFSVGPSLQAHKLRGLRAEVAGLILGSPGEGELIFETLATPLPGDGEKSYVPLFVEIDGATFLEANQHAIARLEVYAYALGADQEVVAFLAEAFAVDIQELGEAVWQSGLKYYGHLKLPPGDYRLRILVRNYHSRASGLRELALKVPAFDRLEQPFVLPLFPPPAARDAWLPVREWHSPTEEYPLWIGQQPISPSARPVLVSGRRSEAYALIHGPTSEVTRGKVDLLRDGTKVTSASLETLSRADSRPQNGPDGLTMTFDVPQVDPGIYEIRIDLAGVTSSLVPVIILQPGTRERNLLWTDLRSQLSRGIEVRETTTAPEVLSQGGDKRPGRREQREIRKLAGRYRQLLGLLSSDPSAARSALLDLESSVLTDGTLPALKPAQMSVAEELCDRELESLIPILALHNEIYSIYRQRNLFSLGFHAREMIELLAELYAERGDSPGSHVVTARVLASLGGYLQAANLPSSSRRLYRRALEHDGNNLAALLGLATSYERYGDYSRAITVLEDLVEAHPSSGEGMLRLAVNLDRLGVRARARGLIERVLQLEPPEWVQSLAHEKMARMLVETGELEAAANLLETYLEKNPQQPGSTYLLAHVYDRQRRPFRSLERLGELLPSQEESPRKTYDSWPETSLHTIRQSLLEAAAIRRNLVSKALKEGTSKS